MNTRPDNRQCALVIADMARRGVKHLNEQKGEHRVITVQGEGMGVQGTKQTITRDDERMQTFYEDALASIGHDLLPLDCVQFEGGDEKWRGSMRHGLKLFVDELDGSNNRTLSTTLMSHSFVGTLVYVPEDREATFGDIQAAVMVNYLDGSSIWAHRNANGEAVTESNGFPILPVEKRPQLLAPKTDSPNENLLNIGDYAMFMEIYYAEIRELMARMFHNRNGNLTRLGNSATEGIFVLSGATGFVSRQKLDEAGALALIVEGADGFVSTFNGSPLRSLPFPIGKKERVELILAPSEIIGRHIVQLVQQHLAT